MRNKLFGLAGFVVLVAGVAGIVNMNETEAAGGDRVVAGVGIVPGQGLVVHVVVLVSPGQGDRAAVNAALAAQGARPLTSSEYSLTGMVHDGPADGTENGNEEVFVVYNGSNTSFDMKTLVGDSMSPWTNVTGSALVFADGGETGRACPSLLRECPGRQTLNGDNEVAFWALKSSNTLAVTWSHSGRDEFDIAFNTKFSWVDSKTDVVGNGVFDVVTVGIHEFGHGAGIGHSDVEGAVMEPVYEGSRRGLQTDDSNALIALYGDASEVDPPPTPEADITGLTVSVPLDDYPNRDRVPITVKATDGADGVAGISVTVRVSTPSGRTLSGSSTTGADGTVVLTYKVNAGRDGYGTYSVVASGGDLTTPTDPPTTFEVIR